MQTPHLQVAACQPMSDAAPPPRLRLAFLADGRSVHTRRWLAFFAGRGHEVSLLSGQDDDLGPDWDDRIAVLRYRRFGRRSLPLLSSLKSRRALRQILRELRPEIVHAHYLSRYGWQARLAGFHPYVLTAWGSDLLLAPRESPYARLWTRAALSAADLVTVPSKHLGAVAVESGARRDRIQLVPFGVDTTEYFPFHADRSMLAASGIIADRILFSPRAIRPVYRQETVVSALARLPEDVEAVIPGRHADPAAFRHLQKRIESLGLVNRVHVLDDIPPALMLELYRAASVVVSVPDSDGLPTSILEAMACGAPVVASDLPGPSEALGPAGARYLVPCGDAAALARSVNEVLALPGTERTAIGVALRARVLEQFDYETSMRRMERLYVELRGSVLNDTR